jgi:succinyl-CoA synthetase beta subunit
MRLFEHQGKELFSRYGIPVPRSSLAHDAAEAMGAAESLGLPVAIKAQVLAGGRGRAGGVAVARTREEAGSQASRILQLRIGGETPRALLVEQYSDVKEELYLSVSLDRGERAYFALASRSGGVDVESHKESGLVRERVPLKGLDADAARAVASRLGLGDALSSQFCSTLLRLERLVREEECELAEVNPLAVLADGTLVALDSKVILDDNALFRHPEFAPIPPEDPLEGEAATQGFAFVRLDGDVAVVGNGAGLVLATLDLVQDAGASAACFLDLGGGAQRERVEAALRLVRALPRARVVLVNIFGGITRTTDVAEGVRGVLAERQMVPVFVRISGADEAKAREMLAASPAKVFATAKEAVGAAVEASR